ncbi:MAG: hypothetical protein J0H14_07540 [Alphaproteobacteria bacterium]|nr:hypothetical protein [Alphaproteobacteria bacterium]
MRYVDGEVGLAGWWRRTRMIATLAEVRITDVRRGFDGPAALMAEQLSSAATQFSGSGLRHW